MTWDGIERRTRPRNNPILSRALIADDNEQDIFFMKKYLSELVKEIDVALSWEEMKIMVKSFDYDLILLDVKFGLIKSDERIHELYTIRPNLNIILTSGADLEISDDVVRQELPVFLNKNKLSVLADLVHVQKMVKEIKGKI